MLSVKADTTKLRARLRGFIRELPKAAAAATIEFADATLSVTTNSALAEWSGNNQVGFDVNVWATLAGPVEIIGGGKGFGILNKKKMGDEATFESIRGVPQLWHQGTRSGARFERLVIQKPGAVARLAQERNAFWGGKEPQWWLMNYGSQLPGAFDPQPGTYTIERSAFGMRGSEAQRIISLAVNTRLRAAGVLI